MASEILAAWLLTVALHASVLLGVAWLIDRGALRTRPAWREMLWRAAFFGGVVTASAQVLLGAPVPARITLPTSAAHVVQTTHVSIESPTRDKASATSIPVAADAKSGVPTTLRETQRVVAGRFGFGFVDVEDLHASALAPDPDRRLARRRFAGARAARDRLDSPRTFAGALRARGEQAASDRRCGARDRSEDRCAASRDARRAFQPDRRARPTHPSAALGGRAARSRAASRDARARDRAHRASRSGMEARDRDLQRMVLVRAARAARPAPARRDRGNFLRRMGRDPSRRRTLARRMPRRMRRASHRRTRLRARAGDGRTRVAIAATYRLSDCGSSDEYRGCRRTRRPCRSDRDCGGCIRVAGRQSACRDASSRRPRRRLRLQHRLRLRLRPHPRRRRPVITCTSRRTSPSTARTT